MADVGAAPRFATFTDEGGAHPLVAAQVHIAKLDGAVVAALAIGDPIDADVGPIAVVKHVGGRLVGIPRFHHPLAIDQYVGDRASMSDAVEVSVAGPRA